MSRLEDLLQAWLPGQRWYGGKGTAISSVVVLDEIRLTDDTDVRHTLVEVHDAAGGLERYQLLLGHSSGAVEKRLDHAVLGDVAGNVVYDAVHDHDAAGALLRLLSEGGSRARLDFTRAGEIDPALPSRVLGVEQSNTSIVYGDQLILKLFRRLQPGANPDLEVTRALADAGSPHVAGPVGWIEGTVDGARTTLGLLQVFLRGASDGWAMATASVRDLFAEGDLHADEVGGDFAGESERLGAATAEVHAVMRQALPSGTAGREDARATARQAQERLQDALAVVPELDVHAAALGLAYDELAEVLGDHPVQRVHGDLHLGQVLRTQDGWVLLDFEGEPARPLSERVALMSPLRDVAGMLRSLDYAAQHLLAERAVAPGPGSDDTQLAYRATEWAERNRTAFCDGYARAAGTDPREDSVRLRAFELDKAVYEVVYEARNRPSWLPVPLGSIARLLGSVA